MYIIIIIIIIIVIVGPKDLATSAHFISSPRPMPRRKKCSRTILFSANRNHGRRKRHATKGSFPGRPKGKHRCNETAVGE